CMSAKRTSWIEFSLSVASAVICLSSGRKFNFSKYIFDNLELLVLLMEKFLLLLKYHPFYLLHHLLHHYNHLKISLLLPRYNQHHHNHLRRVKYLEFDKVAQALKITKLKRRVKKLKRRNKVRVLNLRRLQRVGTSQRVKTSDETVMDDVSNQGRMIAEVDADVNVILEDVKEAADKAKEVAEDAKVDESVDIQGKQAESQAKVDVVTTAKLIIEVVTTASETITAASAIITAAEAQVPAATTAVTLTAAPVRVTTAPTRRRKGLVIRDPEEESTTSTIIPTETKSKDKGKGNLDIDWDEVIDHVKIKAKEDPAVKKYQALKRKPQTEAQARQNMMLYIKNVAGFKMDYFKGMPYDDIRPIFEAKFNSNVAFLLKIKEQIEEDENRALQRLNETPAERAAKRRKFHEDVEELKRYLHIVPNEDDDVYTEATPLARKIWKNQRSVHGLAKVKGWKLLESCGVQIITFTTTQLILLVERKYPLTRFTLDQILNVVRLEVKEESEVSLELLRGAVLDAEAEALLADVECTTPYDQPLAITTTNIFEVSHEDAYDSDVDEGPHVAAAFMANLSSTSGSNGATTSHVNEVHTDDNQIFDNMNHLLAHEMHQKEYLDSDVESDIDDNTISYHQYQLDSEVQDVPTKEQSMVNDSLRAELARCKLEIQILE
nr:hypothetical protein [Tanacetum cinerariifolium]